jgi:hypothetical protein
MTDKVAGPDGSALSEELGPLPEPAMLRGVDEDYYTAEQMRAYGAQERAAERERCAQYLRDAAKRLAPEGKRTSHMDRHTADVLATKGDELAGGCHLRA